MTTIGLGAFLRIAAAAAPVEPAGKPDKPAAMAAGDMAVTAKGKFAGSVSVSDGKQKISHILQIVVTALGGVAADAYSLGPVTVAPLSVDGKPLKLDAPSEFVVIDRSKEGGVAKHPKNGINSELNFGEVPESTKSVGPVKGSVKVLAGGKEKAVSIPDLLTRPAGLLNDPALKAAGLAVKFTRQDEGDNIEVGV